ncbi:MAG: agmatinase [Candidatus Bathyarchaeia archaeon]
MSYLELFTSSSKVFSGLQKDLKEADYVVLGVPFDLTSTYRSGSRFAPSAIREASLNIETYSFRSGIDLEELKIHDAGDLHVSADVEEMLRRLELVTKDLFRAIKAPILIGGEHTITLGAVRGFDREIAIVIFDAHLDLRDEYLDQRVCHATSARRLCEEAKVKKVIEVGTRAVCREELEYAKKTGVRFFTSRQVLRYSAEDVSKDVRSFLDGCEAVYLSVDMDVLDPAFAPGVQNPEPDGLTTHLLLDLLCDLCDSRVVGFDVTEVTPHYDTGVTAIQAAKVIFEVLCSLEKNRRQI